MDQDLKKSLKDMADAIAALTRIISSEKQVTVPTPQSQGLVQIWGPRVGMLVGVLCVLGTFWGMVNYTVSSEITKAFIKPNSDEASLEKDFEYLRKDVDKLMTQRYTDTLAHPSGVSSKELGDAALQLRDRKTVIPRQIVAEAGRAVLKDVSDNPESWDATARLLEYVSFLNAEANAGASFHMTLVPQGFKPPDADADTYFINPPGWQGELRDGPASLEPDVAKLHPIGLTTPSQTRSYGPAWLLMEGGTIRLDGQFMKRIVVRDAEVIYDGGPVSLDGVYFLNCRFVLPRKPSSELFASAVMSPDPETKFKSGF